MEAYDAFADVEYWSGNYAKAVEYCDLALKKEPENEDFLFKKAKILHSSENYEGAVASLEELVRINGSNAEALKKTSGIPVGCDEEPDSDKLYNRSFRPIV